MENTINVIVLGNEDAAVVTAALKSKFHNWDFTIKSTDKPNQLTGEIYQTIVAEWAVSKKLSNVALNMYMVTLPMYARAYLEGMLYERRIGSALSIRGNVQKLGSL